MSATNMDQSTDPGNKSASEIEGEVEQTRARVTETIEALRDRMSPGQMVDQVMEYARGSGGADFMRNFGTSVRDNPLPVAMIGAGIAWLMLSGDRKASPGRDAMLALPAPVAPATTMHGTSASGSGMMGTARARVSGVAEGARDALGSGAGAIGDAAERARGAASRAVDAITGVASSAAEAISDTASGAANAASRLAGGVADATSDAASGVAGTADHLLHQAREGVGRAADAGSARAGSLASSASSGWSRIAEEQPLLLGALGLALGAALGAILPRTRTEDELMGRTSDELTERAGAAAQSGMERAAEMAGQQLNRAQSVVADTYAISKDKLNKDGLTADTVGDVVGTAASRLADAAKETVRGVTEEARKGLGSEGGGEQQASPPPETGQAKPVAPASGATGPTAFPAATPSSGAGSTTRSGPL
ncbi:DUF3618 domain-containing protein [Roseomonas sp. KE2513]|uniref:DUF3618 domain-containing protein n=1 Tax=Roseomonas sp. KE2513 TaxID=2479202 RepID=UPI0018E01BAD|nr:DUF3618 domain-containing protein [Roseomonas sp. KE2513]MBI0537380.1 DUF3618 domain-containing protein [Roseomonas sp. KE2513]